MAGPFQPHDPQDYEDNDPLKLAMSLLGMVEPPREPVVEGVNALTEAMRRTDAFFANADRTSWDATFGVENRGYNPDLRQADNNRERGMPDILAETLGFVSEMGNPFPLDFVGDALKVAGVAGTAASMTPRGLLRPDLVDLAGDATKTAQAVDAPVSRAIIRDANGNPIRTWRVQTPGAESLGPVAEDLGLPPSSARYHGTPEYIRGIANNSGRGDNFIVREGFPRSVAGGVLDAEGITGSPDMDLMARIEEAAIRRYTEYFEQYPNPVVSSQLDYLKKDFEDYRAGTIDLHDMLDTLRGMFGNDLGPIPQDAGLDVILQRADDGRSMGLEVVTFGGNNTWQDLNVMTLEEARNYIPPKRR